MAADAWRHPYQDRQDPARAAAGAPFPTDWPGAQPYCNFVVLEPAGLPTGWVSDPPTVRPEGGSGEGGSSVRAILRRASTPAAVRLKQGLWDGTQEPWPDPNLKQKGEPRLVGGAVAWLGGDHLGRFGAGWSRWRTFAELSVVGGDVGGDDLCALLATLRPAWPAAVDDLCPVPLTVLSSSVRLGRSHWGEAGLAGLTWGDMAPAVRAAALPVLPLPDPGALPTGYAFESAGWRTWPDGGRELQVLYRDRRNWTDCVWLRAVTAGCGAAPTCPPARPLPEYWSGRMVDGVWYGCVDPRYGTRRAVWVVGGSDRGVAVDLWLRSTPDVDEAGFWRIVRGARQP